MREVKFYHLRRRGLELGLTRLLELSTERGIRSVVRLPDDDMCRYYDEYLWTYKENSFLAHGLEKDGDLSYQPICLTSGLGNPNGSEVLMIGGGFVGGQDFEGFRMVCYVFGDEDVAQKKRAREEWVRCRSLMGVDVGEMSYWQEEGGKWLCKKHLKEGEEALS